MIHNLWETMFAKNFKATEWDGYLSDQGLQVSQVKVFIYIYFYGGVGGDG